MKVLPTGLITDVIDGRVEVFMSFTDWMTFTERKAVWEREKKQYRKYWKN